MLPYNDGRPAMLERPVGQGRVLTMTTPVSDRPNQNPWNLLPVGEAWPFLILANQMVAYLVGSSDQQLNYLAGQTAVLQLDADARRAQLPAVRARRPQLSHLGRSEAPRAGDHRHRSGGQLPAPGGRQPAAWTSASASTTPRIRRGSTG